MKVVIEYESILIFTELIFNNIDYPLNLSISLKGGKETN